ncbi:MAG: PAS domain S-box protein [Magnetococcales bacterium]|nr:PAS domain S-box protein [Magnetococcales bacterium]
MLSQGFSAKASFYLFIAALFTGGTLVYLAYWHTRNIEQAALKEAAKSYSRAITTFRNFYTKEILEKVHGTDVEVSHDYKEKRHTIPIPATMTIDLAKKISRLEENLHIDIVSRYPFPWRKDQKLSPAMENALVNLHQTSSDQYTEIARQGDQDILFYASPIRMKKACVSCHNSHPDSPKQDWRIGEIRGLQVVSMPIGRISSNNRLGLAYIIGFIVFSFISAFSVILWLVNRNQLAFAELSVQANRLKKTFKELHFFKEALDHHSIVSIADSKGNITYANEKFCSISGYSQEDLLGANHRIVSSEEHDEAFFATLWKTIASGKVWHGDIKNKAKDGSQYWVNSTIVPFLDDDGKPFQYISIRTNITSQKHQEAEAERSRRFIEAIANTIGEGVLSLDTYGRCTFINPEGERLLGSESSSLIGQDIHRLIHEHDQPGREVPTHECMLFKQRKPKEAYRSDDERFIRKNGQSFDASVVAIPLYINEVLQGSVIVFQDITERKQAETALRESEERFRQVASTAHEAIITINEDGQITFWNQAATKTFGYKEDEVIGITLDAVIPKSLMTSHKVGLEKAVETGVLQHQGKTLDLPAICKDGTQIQLEVVLSTWITQGKRYFTAMGRDVTERNIILAELADAKAKAEQANQAKGDFLANMSHEIRTPMNAIIGLSHLAMVQSREEQQSGYLSKIHQAGQSLLRIINDILDFSKIEAGKLEIEKTLFKLDEVLENLTSLVALKAHEKNLELIITRTLDIPERLFGDSLRLNQILLNLVGNAVKFTEQGEILLQIEKGDMEGEQLRIHFAIIDSGIGMSAQQVKNLFSAFSQADTSITRKFGGTGLGLTISKQLIELMGGKIDVESEPGQGSRFDFSILVNFDSDSVAVSPTFKELHDIPVLLISRPGLNRDAFTDMLISMQTKPVVYDNDDALLADSIAAKARLVIWDPGFRPTHFLNTIETIRHHFSNLQLPFLVLLPHGDQYGSVLELEKTTNVHHLLKPVTFSTLFGAFASILLGRKAHRGRNTQSALSVGGGAAYSKMLGGRHILIVEDNKVNQQIAFELLDMINVTSDVAQNGQIAIQKIQQNNYDAVLMDIQMPVMDGFEATRRLRQDLGKKLPIIALSASAMSADREKSIEAGMIDHVTKPIDPMELYQTLNRWIGQGDIVELGVEEDMQAKGAIPSISGMNMQIALQRAAGSQDLLRKLLVDFCNDQKNVVDRIRQALNDGQRGNAVRQAHTLKGLAGSISAGGLQKYALEVENMLDNSDAPQEQLDEMLDHLQVHILDLINNIQSSTIFESESQSVRSEKASEIDLSKLYDMAVSLKVPIKARDPQKSREILDELNSFMLPGFVQIQVEKLTKMVQTYRLREAGAILSEILTQLSTRMDSKS